MPDPTDSPDHARSPTLKQALLILAIILLGLGGLGAQRVLRASPSAASKTTSLQRAEQAAPPVHTQLHREANANDDVGPGQAEPALVSSPPAVR